MLVMGIDGGGSTLRVGVFDTALNPVREVTRRENCNPSVRGHDAIRDLLRDTINAACAQIPGGNTAIRAVGVGIAGADAARSRDWLTGVLSPVLPQAIIVPSSDYEIALVGARGERYGVLLLAGTGSISYGVNRDGATARVGGWGYLLESEGSGFWVGLQAVKALVDVIDRQTTDTPLTARLVADGVPHTRDALVAWMYAGRKTDEIARLATTVLEVAATTTDPTAANIVAQAAARLVADYRTICELLNVDGLPVAFAGGLLTHDNVLSRQLTAALNLPTPPQPQASPLVGAARLALAATSR